MTFIKTFILAFIGISIFFTLCGTIMYLKDNHPFWALMLIIAVMSLVFAFIDWVIEIR